MELKISENLKKLRKERGNTQDDLANHIGISVQAVSKWERGDGFPDIALLPYIASYYEVTVDDILGCNSLRKQEDIAAFRNQAHILINKGKRKERLALCREMQKKYPNDEYVLYNLMYDLWAVEHAKNSEEIICIATKLLKSDSLEIRYGAIQMLAFTYSKLGNDEKAVEYAKMVPCNRDLLSSVLKGKELVEHCRWYFWDVCNTMLRLSHNMIQCPEAGYTADDILYINAHGTSTPLNDKTETNAIKLALGEDAARKAYISSTKSMTGHMLGAAGGVELIASALAVKHGIVPPTINYKEPDPECDLNYVPNRAVEVDITMAASNSLGFGGHNACVVLKKI